MLLCTGTKDMSIGQGSAEKVVNDPDMTWNGMKLVKVIRPFTLAAKIETFPLLDFVISVSVR